MMRGDLWQWKVFAFWPDICPATFKRRMEWQLKGLWPEKCYLLQREFHHLGHVISKHDIPTDPGKIQVVKELKAPRCRQEVKSFLDLV